MNTARLDARPAPTTPSVPRSARRLLDLLAQIDIGQLRVELPNGESMLLGQADANGRTNASLRIHHWKLFDDVLARGDIGFGEAYIDGHFDSPDLAALLTLLNLNRKTLASAVHGRWWGLLLERLRHLRNANTRAGSRRNIMAHYDLGNDFYQAWLDPTMSYSSALFADPQATLEQAQLAKYRHILRTLGIKPGQRVLEIGCGWGGFAEVAAREAGAHVTGITLSPAQLAFAQKRMQAAGLEAQCRLLLLDYRDLSTLGTRFDHVVSIEMFEAVGQSYWAGYFDTVEAMLQPGGSAVVQTITIADALFKSYRKGTDFIQQHVFPGGMLPSPSVFRHGAQQAGLLTSGQFAFGADYARTLALWQAAFQRRWAQIQPLGFDDCFARLWNFYLAYCQAGFNAGTTDVMQFHLRKPA